MKLTCWLHHGFRRPRTHAAFTRVELLVVITIVAFELVQKSAATWFALLTQGQIAATPAACLGKDYRHDVPRASSPIADVLSGNKLYIDQSTVFDTRSSSFNMKSSPPM